MAKKQTFAQRAKAIQSKYKKRLGEDLQKNDYLARQAMNMELQKLKEEQENVRMQQGISDESYDNYNPTMSIHKKGGKLPKLQGGDGEEIFRSINNKLLQDPSGTGIGGLSSLTDEEILYLQNINGIDNISPEIDIPETNLRQSTPRMEEKSPEYYNPTVSAIPLAASIAGNAYHGLTAKDNINVPEYDRMTPEEINLGAQRESIRRRSEATKNTIGRQARGLGLSGGAATTRSIIGLTEADKVAGEALSKSYMQEELANTQARERAERFNLGLKAREEDMRVGQETAASEAENQAIQNILQSISGYATDVNRAKTYADITNMMSPEYAMYEDPEQSLINKIAFGSNRRVGFRG